MNVGEIITYLCRICIKDSVKCEYLWGFIWWCLRIINCDGVARRIYWSNLTTSTLNLLLREWSYSQDNTHIFNLSNISKILENHSGMNQTYMKTKFKSLKSSTCYSINLYCWEQILRIWGASSCDSWLWVKNSKLLNCYCVFQYI